MATIPDGSGAGESVKQMRQYTVRAEILVALRRLIRLLPQPELAGVPVQLHLVLDTNVVVEDLRFLAAKRRIPTARTALQELFASETVVPYYPVEALPELNRTLDEIASRGA